MSQLKRFDTINVVPFIDVMLVLLAMVLLVSTFTNQNQINIDLPQTSSPLQPEKESVKVRISNLNEIYINDLNTPLNEVKEYIKALPTDQSVCFQADKKSSFGVFVELIDTLKSTGHDKILILTEYE